MNTSLRLLLEDFLGLMREDQELDIFLPLLLSSMGHEIIYRAQKGIRQYGVDIVSVGTDEIGDQALFLWLVKRGDITRSNWNSGPQSVKQSLDDILDVYLRSHVSMQHALLRKKVMILTNGDFNASLNETIAAVIEASAERGVNVTTVNGSALAGWAEQYLLDEYILPSSHRSLFRRMLANVGTPEVSVDVGMRLFRSMLATAKSADGSEKARLKAVLTALRGVRTALSVLFVWASNEDNLCAPYRLSEFVILAVWESLHDKLFVLRDDVSQEFVELLLNYTSVAEAYHAKLEPYYRVQDAFASGLPDSVLVTARVFEEIGRLGLMGYVWLALRTPNTERLSVAMSQLYSDRLIALLNTHSCSNSPDYDHQAIDVHMGLLFLLAAGRKEEAIIWLRGIVTRIGYVVHVPKYWPVSTSFEELYLIRHGYEEVSEDIRSTSTLLPILLMWTAVLGERDGYKFLRESIFPAISEHTTLNFWSCDVGHDAIIASQGELHAHGVGEALVSIQENPDEFIRKMKVPLPGVEPMENLYWCKLNFCILPMISSVVWRLQVPRELMVNQAVDASSYSLPAAEAG